MNIPHQHDKPWRDEQVASLPYTMQKKAIDGYKAAWIETYEKHKDENKARFAANTRLRLFVDKIKGR